MLLEKSGSVVTRSSDLIERAADDEAHLAIVPDEPFDTAHRERERRGAEVSSRAIVVHSAFERRDIEQLDEIAVVGRVLQSPIAFIEASHVARHLAVERIESRGRRHQRIQQCAQALVVIDMHDSSCVRRLRRQPSIGCGRNHTDAPLATHCWPSVYSAHGQILDRKRAG